MIYNDKNYVIYSRFCESTIQTKILYDQVKKKGSHLNYCNQCAMHSQIVYINNEVIKKTQKKTPV